MEACHEDSDFAGEHCRKSKKKSSKINVKNEDEIIVQGLYSGEEAKGFDTLKGGEWIYPINYPVRSYQKNIVSNALFKNTLVCLPTGLGKTFIAAVVMYNYHRWYPCHLVVFMAHSKPLVAQQVDACCNIMGIPISDIAELNGNMSQANRKKQWESKKIFFLTPQVFNNDLARGNVKPESIRCIVIDEAHKALGNQAYCQVIRSVKPFNSNFRVLALSATPGDDMNMVKEVIQNLMISHLELRSEEDPDITPYLHEKKIETVVVKLDKYILELKEKFLSAVDKYVQPLVRHKAIPQSIATLNPFSLVLKQRQFAQNPNVKPEIRGLMLSNFSIAISLFHALEELTIHGVRSFHSKLKSILSGEGSTNNAHYRLAKDDEIKLLIDEIDNYLGPEQNVVFDASLSLTRIFDEVDAMQADSNIAYSHPKFIALEKIIQDHFESYQGSTRVIVFCKSRMCTGELCNFLSRFKPLVKPMIFIGQSQTTSGTTAKGFNQAAQLTVMKRFRDGVYNTLIATCVAEEGLDIGEVDLIVNFDSGRNSNTLVQRSGRTGRKRNGRVVNLVTEGKEHQNYNISVSKGKKIRKRLVTDATKLPFYQDNPRLIPNDLEPACMEMFFVIDKKQADAESKQSNKKTATTGQKGKGKGKKKLTDTSFEEDKSSKRIKMSETGLGKMLTSMSQKKFDSISQCDNNNDDDIHIIPSDDEEDKYPKLFVFDSEIKDSADERWWEGLEEEEALDEEEKFLVRNFLENNKSRRSISTFKRIVGQELEKYVKADRLDDDTLRTFTDLGITDVDLNYLKVNDKNDLWASACGNDDGSEKENKPLEEEMAFPENFDFDGFLEPMEAVVPKSTASPPKMISSTPMRKPVEAETIVKERNISRIEMPPPQASKAIIPESPNMWGDEEDFFDVKADGATSTKKSANVNHSSVFSVSQALDFVKDSHLVEEKERPTSPVSPILFMSQRGARGSQKTSCTLDDSPILTQKPSQRKPATSRKCLSFDKVKTPSPVPDNVDSSDLFAEAEFEFQNEMEELEAKLREIEKKEDRSAASEALSPNLMTKALSDENIEGYNFKKVNFEASCSQIDKEKLNERSMKNEDSSIFNPTKNVSDRKSDMFNLSSFNQNDFSDVTVKGSVAKTPDRKPKLAIVRPIGFENLPLSRNVSVEAKPSLKSENSSFGCNFSLFDDDDFGEVCLEPKGFEAPNNNESKHSADKAVDHFKNMTDDYDLSDGAMEAIKAVEMYEKDARLAKKAEMAQAMNLDLCDFASDDSDEFFVPKKRLERKSVVETDEKAKTKRRKKTEGNTAKDFIEEEAELSEGETVSSDEEENELDVYDSSFVDERDVLTQAPNVDMTAKYLQSMKSPRGGRPGTFKIPKVMPNANVTEIFSQIGSEGESEYENDSFCVSEEEPSVVQDMSELEVAEIVLANKREKCEDKRKVADEVGVIPEKNRKFKRIRKITSDSEDDDEPDVVIIDETKCEKVLPQSSTKDDSDIRELFNSPFPIEDEICGMSSDNITSKAPSSTETIRAMGQPSVFIASRQIASAPEITTCLRAKWNVNVQVRSVPEADYIVSWRVGVNRIQLSEFASGSAEAKNSLKEILSKLTYNFTVPVLVVEENMVKAKGGVTGTPSGCQKTMWPKHSYRTIVNIMKSNVKLLFSRSKDDTARIIALLCNEEMLKGHHVCVEGEEIKPDVEKRMKFYSNLPGVNVANAFRLSTKYPTIASFTRSCDSVRILEMETGLKKEDAVSVYQMIFTCPA